MKIIFELTLLLLAASLNAGVLTTAPSAPLLSGKLGAPIQLFDGKDLDGWTFSSRAPKAGAATAPAAKREDVWTIKDAILHDTGTPIEEGGK